jgi:molybdenum cofactor cytidylyltransferase
MTLGLILLAAGGSTRLGSPKQLLSYGGRTLLRRAAETALGSIYRPVIAVLGAGAERLRGELSGLEEIQPVENPLWERGMGSSLRAGLTALLAACRDHPPDGALFMLCDQPLISSAMLDAFGEAFRRAGSPYSLVAARYGDGIGVPALFGRGHFEELLALPDESGAKSLLCAHRAQVLEIPLPQAAIDIDTREQYERLLRGEA